MPQRPPTKQTAPAEIISQCNLGYNGYTDPTLTKPQMWRQAVNCFSGAFGYIQRCRFANVVWGYDPYGIEPYGVPGYGGTGQPYTSLKYYSIPTVGSYLLGDINGQLFSFDTSASYTKTQRLNPYVDPSGAGSASLNGPWSREVIQNIAYEMNGTVKSAGRNANAATIEGFGLDAPDASPQVILVNPSPATQAITAISRSNGTVTVTVASTAFLGITGNSQTCNIIGVADTNFNGTFLVTVASGTTFTYTQLGQNVGSSGGTASIVITKAVGRSYSYAWENANKSHVGAPSPATQYIAYNSQNGSIQLIEPGLLAGSSGSPVITGTNTFFTSAWVGRHLWIPGLGDAGRVISVASQTSLTLDRNSASNFSGSNDFQVFDPQATHIRLYATADGGATYFRIARNAWNPNTTNFSQCGLQFFDNANSEPPNFPFTSETAQANNLPPPIGKFIRQYQGRPVVFGVTGALQSFFYGNSELTSIGLPQESFAPLNQVTLPIANGQIYGYMEFPGTAIFLSDKQDMFRLSGLLSDNSVSTATQQGATIARLPYNLGSAHPEACIITPLGGLWITSNAELWLYTDRYAPRNIGRPVQDILNSIAPSMLPLARAKYVHANNRNWAVFCVAANQDSKNNTALVLDLDLLASNGSPSYFVFDMATNHPAWWVFKPGPVANGAIAPRCDSIEVVYENNGLVRVLAGSVDLIQDIDYQQGGAGTEIPVTASVQLHAWGNDTAPVIKRPTWFRFNTNRDPSVLANETTLSISSVSRSAGVTTVTTTTPHGLGVGASVFIAGVTDSSFNVVASVDSVTGASTFTFNQSGANTSSSGGTVASGWSFAVSGVDDDFYTFASPLTLNLIPGVNDSSALGGNPDFATTGLAFRHSPEMFRVGGVNFVMGRRLMFQVNFPSGIGTNYQFRSAQLGFGPTPPR